MKHSTYIQISTTLTLETQEQFLAYTRDKGFTFRVSTITWNGNEWVTLRGQGVKVNGDTAFIHRQESRKFDSLAEHHKTALRNSRQESIEELFVREGVRNG